ncbi:MAG TPA: cytochrome c biogenesis protein CcdA, partial [Fimbriiglobus sp.]|nr:cytochrome c biogenesis protein CcdA [Fimbriiglobus sp.]
MRNLLLALGLALLAGPAAGQESDLPFKLPGAGSSARSFDDIADSGVTVEPAKARPGQTVTVKLTVAPKPGAWTYPVNPPGDQLSRNDFTLPKSGDLIFVGAVTDPPGWKAKPSILDPLQQDQYYPHEVTWELSAVVSPKAASGKKTVALKGVSLLACIEGGKCFNSRIPPSASFEVLAGEAVPVDAKYRAEVEQALGGRPKPAPPSPAVGPPTPHVENAAGVVKKAAVPPDRYETQLHALQEKIDKTPVVVKGGFWGLLLAAAFWGFVSLVTPCVFPMIPITVSLFLKQSHQSQAQVLKLAVVYCLTIIAVLGASAVFLLWLFRELSVDPRMNIFLGLLFIFFALSLFGMYDIALPGFLLRATEKRRGAGGMVGTVFGALAFSIVSFTCVAPFLGGFAGMADSQRYSQFELILAGIVFAAAFASPFFVLALFPSLIKKLPKSGGWLDSVKVVMGFLELAAAFKFFRTAELRLLDHPQYFTYDLVLGAWVAIAAATGLYLLGVFRLPHDEERPNVGVGRMLLGVSFLTLAVYLTPALFKGGSGQANRPGGVVYAWVDAFLLPEPTPAGEGLPWSADLVGTVERISRDRQSGGTTEKPLVFVDFT